jgi:hypothetical protein
MSMTVRFDPTHPEYGTFLTSEEVRRNLAALSRANDLRPIPGSEGDSVQPMTVWVEAGTYMISGNATVFAGGHSVDFAGYVPVLTVRRALVYLDLAGILQTRIEIEGDPIAAYPADIIPIAEVTLVPLMTNIVYGDIQDVRPMFIASAVGQGVNPTEEVFISTVGQTDFTLSTFVFSPGSHEILVFAGGVRKTTNDGLGNGDYDEVGGTTIRFNSARPTGEIVVIYRIGRASAHSLSDLDDVDITLSEGIRDVDGRRYLSTAALNPLATLEDIRNNSTFGIPFANEHNISTGEHGPHVSITQTVSNTALSINKSGTGGSSAVNISNSSNSSALQIVQTGDPATDGAITITTAGTASALRLVQGAVGSAISITQTGNGDCLLVANSGTGNVIHITNTGVGKGILVENSGSGAALKLKSAGSGSDIEIDGLGTVLGRGDDTLDPLWGGAVSDCDKFHTHSSIPSVFADLTDISTNQSDALQGAALPSAVNPLATVNDLPTAMTDLDVSSAESAAIHNADSPSISNPFATISDMSNVKMGTYTGTGASQTVSVGFNPDWIMLYNTSAVCSGAYVARGANGRLFTGSSALDLVVVTGGFSVTNNITEINYSGSNYIYIAIKGNM